MTCDEMSHNGYLGTWEATYVKELHHVVDAIRIAPRYFEIPGPRRAGRDYHCVILLTDLLSVDVDSDTSVVDECLVEGTMSLGFHQNKSALHD
jgi:hypothetical protein